MTEPSNPYAPPVETPELAPPAPASVGRLALSHEATAAVNSLCRWMRIVSTFLYVAGTLMAVASLGALIGGGKFMSRLGGASAASGAALGLSALIMAASTVLFFVAGAWLRQSAEHFHNGVLSKAQGALARGFHGLRLYLILYGTFAILELVSTVVQLVAARPR